MNAKDTLKYADVGRQEALRDCEEKGYNDVERSFIIEFWDDVIEACEKQIPKEPKMYIGEYDYERYPLCSGCNTELMPNGERYCSECGQAIDWSEK